MWDEGARRRLRRARRRRARRRARGPSPAVSIEITGLSLYTHHGVGEAEREVGQRLVFDISFELDECDATVTDRVEDTINYAEVCEQVALGAQERSYKTLERLCAAVADRLIDRFGADSVRVKATKPEPPIPLPVEEVSVEVWKESLRLGYLGLGSNVGDRLANLRAARDALGAHGVEVLASSSVYETAPQGELLDQPDFLNACLRIRTALGPGGAARRRARPSSASSAASRAASATGRARSMWTCCCSATSSTAPSAFAPAPGGHEPALRDRAAARARPGPGAAGRHPRSRGGSGPCATSACAARAPCDPPAGGFTVALWFRSETAGR